MRVRKVEAHWIIASISTCLAFRGTIWLMIRFVRIGLAIIAAAAVVGFAQRELGLQDFAWGLGDGVSIAIALLLASLSDREFFYGTPPKRPR